MTESAVEKDGSHIIAQKLKEAEQALLWLTAGPLVAGLLGSVVMLGVFIFAALIPG